MHKTHGAAMVAGIVVVLAAAAGPAWSQGLQAARPQPGALATLVPDAPKAGPPAWAKPGLRLVYFGASASIPGEGTQLVLDPNGHWVNKATGQKWGEQEVPGPAGAGFSTYEIGYVDRDMAVLSCKMYLLDTLTNKVSFVSASGLVATAGCASDLWVHPAALAKVQEVNANGVLIMRMPYTVNNHRYNAIRFQTETNLGCTAYVYDLDSGLLVFHGSSAQGAGVLTPPPAGGGLAGAGRGNTQLVTGWLMEVKQVAVPWAGAAVPAWVDRFQELDYRGVHSTGVAGSGQLDRPMTAVIQRKGGGPGWVRTSATVTIQSPYGMPPEQNSQDGACGAANIGGIWIGPDGLAGLRQGQVIDRSDVTQTVTSVSNVGPRQVTISEVGPLHRLDWTYDTTSGVLVGMTLGQQVGVGMITHRVALAGQR